MESLYFLIPISLVIVLLIGGFLAWSVLGGQFDDLDAEGRRILDEDETDPTRPAPVKPRALLGRQDSHTDSRPGDR